MFAVHHIETESMSAIRFIETRSMIAVHIDTVSILWEYFPYDRIEEEAKQTQSGIVTMFERLKVIALLEIATRVMCSTGW